MLLSACGGPGNDVLSFSVMKGAAELRRILVDELGFHDLAAYQRWIREVRPTLALTPERLELLSPDVIDCNAFWTVCDELFGADPVCNLAVAPEVGRLPYAVESTMDANRFNLRFAASFGVLAFLEENANARLQLLEIGTGYGSIKSFVETRTNHIYTGVDVVPRVPGVIEATADGLFPRELVTEKKGAFSYVVSSNVFQHLSARQRTRYIEDSRVLLHDGGLFLMNLTVDTGKVPKEARDKQGNAWADHYGQFTLIPKGGAIYDELSRSFAILYVTQRYDGIFNFVCQKK